MLDLSYRKLTLLEEDSAEGKASIVNLSNNLFQGLPRLESFKQLTHLDLSYNRLKSVEKIQSLSGLARLELSHNMVVDLSPLAKLACLTYLDLSYNQVFTTEHLINRGLETLHLHHNHLDKVTGLASFKLKELTLAHNKIRVVDTLHKVKGTLQILDLSSNQIKYFRQFFEMSLLTSLYLGDNLIESIEESGKNLEHLETLDLSQNRIEGLKGFSAYFPQLFALDVSHNQLMSDYELKYLSGLESLIDLQLQGNDCISESQLDTFQRRNSQIQVVNGQNNPFFRVETWVDHEGDEGDEEEVGRIKEQLQRELPGDEKQRQLQQEQLEFQASLQETEEKMKLFYLEYRGVLSVHQQKKGGKQESDSDEEFNQVQGDYDKGTPRKTLPAEEKTEHSLLSTKKEVFDRSLRSLSKTMQAKQSVPIHRNFKIMGFKQQNQVLREKFGEQGASVTGRPVCLKEKVGEQQMAITQTLTGRLSSTRKIKQTELPSLTDRRTSARLLASLKKRDV